MKLTEILHEPWAITPDKKNQIDEIYATHLRGEKIDIPKVEAAIGRSLNNQPVGYQTLNGVAVIDIEGVISRRMNLFSKISGGSSTEQIVQAFAQAIADPEVTSIVLRFDSPGGPIEGSQDLADRIFAARGTKPIIAVADEMMASKAYWIGAAADAIYATSPTAFVGSIGVVATHRDFSVQEVMRGVRTTEVVAGKYKRVGSGMAPLNGEGFADMQSKVDHIYGIMLGAVAKYRGQDVDEVHATMADGRVFIGQQAQDAGLIDGIAPLDRIVQACTLAFDGSFDGDVATVLAASLQEAAGVAAFTHSLTQETDNMQQKTLSADEAKTQVDAAVSTERQSGEAKLAEQTRTHTAAIDTMRAEAATAETTRVKGILALGKKMPGHDALVEEMAYDGKTTVDQASTRLIDANASKLAGKKTDLTADAPKPVAAATAPATEAAEVTIDPQALAQKAREYQAEQSKLGRQISAAEAVAHITAKETK